MVYFYAYVRFSWIDVAYILSRSELRLIYDLCICCERSRTQQIDCVGVITALGAGASVAIYIRVVLWVAWND